PGREYSMASASQPELVYVPLGGVGEIGMNMGLYGFGPENDRHWLVVDCGVTFGGPELPGIDLIMPDPSFLEEHADRVVGLILTHAHEDHYGAVLDLWPGFDKPVYATRFAAAMLRAKRAANHIEEDVDVEIFVPGVPLQLGPFRIEAIDVAHSIPESTATHIAAAMRRAKRDATLVVENVDVEFFVPGAPFQLEPFRIEAIDVAHSIPESTALLIETPLGRVLHTGDWKIDTAPIGTPRTN